MVERQIHKNMNIKQLQHRIISHLKAVGDILLPRQCIVCRKKLLLHERHICIHCLADMPLTRFWEQSRNPMADRFNSMIQSELEAAWDEYVEKGYERYAYACALFYYDLEGAYRQIPHQLKYQGNIAAGRYFSRMLGIKMSLSRHFNDVDCVIPVPLHRKRKWKRGYNQAEIIALEIGEVLKAEVRTDILHRTRETATQTKLSIEEKGKNVKGAFEIHRQAGNFRHILIVDDIFTTGATLHACFTALRSGYPSSVRISVATLGFVGH